MLNPRLYEALCRCFGRDQVRVIYEDIEAEPDYRRVADNKNGGTRTIVHDMLVQGEEYVLNCPFCGDSRQRLYINHTWGVRDPRTGSRNLFAFQCFNSSCQVGTRPSGEPNFEWLQRRIKNSLASQAPLVLDRQRAKKWKAPSRVELPGLHWRLDQLSERMPEHEAVFYLEQRLINPVYLGQKFGVGFCPEAQDMRAARRIVAPVLLDGRLVSWTARYVGNPPDYSITKWVHCPGVKIGNYLYNFDRGIRHQTWVLTEGPGDVWSFGIQAMAVFGKVVRVTQVERLLQYVQPDTTIVLLLDPTLSPDDVKRKRKHHIERSYELLNRYPAFQGRILRVYLPCDRDPGSTDRWFMRDFISWRAEQEGLQVDFSREGVRDVEPRKAKTQAQAEGTAIPGFAQKAVGLASTAAGVAHAGSRHAARRHRLNSGGKSKGG